MILSECISLKAVLWKVQFRSYICVSGGIICFVTCMWLDFDVQCLKGCNVLKKSKFISCILLVGYAIGTLKTQPFLVEKDYKYALMDIHGKQRSKSLLNVNSAFLEAKMCQILSYSFFKQLSWASYVQPVVPTFCYQIPHFVLFLIKKFCLGQDGTAGSLACYCTTSKKKNECQ